MLQQSHDAVSWSGMGEGNVQQDLVSHIRDIRGSGKV